MEGQGETDLASHSVSVNDSTAATYSSYRKLKRKLDITLMKLREVRDQGVKALSEPSQIPYFKGMVRSLDKYMENADAIWEELTELDEEHGAASLITREDREIYARVLRYFHEASSAAESFPTMSRVSVTTVNNTSSDRSQAPRKSHPVIPIPKFNGDITQWRHFRDKFESLIMKDESLADIERYHYLSGSLEGPAMAVIENLPITGANFVIAWKTLNDTYDNPRLIASTYLDQFLDVQPLPHNPPASSIRLLIAQLTKAVAAFNTFDIATPLEFVFFHLAKRCLDKPTQEAFEWEHRKTVFPTFDQLISFLKSRCEIQELNSGPKLKSSSKPPSHSKDPKSFHSRSKPVKHIHTLATNTSPGASNVEKNVRNNGDKQTQLKCFLCNEEHTIHSCDRFKGLSVDQRHNSIKDWSGCKNCLLSDHSTGRCKSRWRCRYCRGKHHSLLHRDTDIPVTVAFTRMNEDSAVHSSRSNSSGLHSLLGTMVTQVASHLGPPRLARAILDSASHVSFITKSMAHECGLHIRTCDIKVQGLSETPIPGLEGITHCTIMSSKYPGICYNINALVVQTIMTPQPAKSLKRTFVAPYLKYDLADPEFWVSRSVDLLLGCDIFADLLTGEVITISGGTARLMGTVFGHVVIGRVDEILACAPPSVSLTSTAQNTLDQALYQELQRFWTLDEPPTAKLMNEEEKKCDAHFRETVSRLESGRYMVRLSFNKDPTGFDGFRGMALRRLTHLESKLQRNPRHKDLYHAFMKEYRDLGHMEEASHPGVYYIPHHGVFKGYPPNEKVRVVFDASAPSRSGSLNDHMWTGPKLQNDLPTILLNFRKHPYVFTADIAKMYRQILVHPDDRKCQHILWRSDPSSEVTDYELKTITYGMSCAPYLALRVIRQLVCDEGSMYPLASAAILSDMYVDDLVSGAATLQEAKDLQRQVIELMARGEFPLNKWASNCKELLEVVGVQGVTQDENMSLDLEPENYVKILGLQWNHQQDTFTYQVDLPSPVFTKRGLLSLVAKIYDPLGFLAPVIVAAKMVLQEAWREKLDWDSPLPIILRNSVEEFCAGLPSLSRLRIPRLVVAGKCTHLMMFADASSKAYCAAAYLRTVGKTGASCRLLIARTKLAPLKPQTIPRLELCAAVLAVNLLEGCKGFLSRLENMPDVLLFTDSRIVLSWIKKPHSRLPPFVANRVARILEVTSPSTWNHVQSSENPSDLGSRGISPSQISINSLWFEGPEWTRRPSSTWSFEVDDKCVTPLDESEIFPAACLLTPVVSTENWIERISSYQKLLRITAWILRFKNNSNPSAEVKLTGSLSLEELKSAEVACCRSEQGRYFHIDPLSRVIKKTPKQLLSLAPFFDDQGLLRVGGRLKHSPLPIWSRHPVLLPAKSHLARLIVAYFHRVSLHPGPSLLTAMIRSRFWIVGLRNLARKVCRECVQCRRADAPTCQPAMGNLPLARFKEGRAFLHIGLDFGGPFLIRESTRRKAATSKAYLCLAICLSTRAIHLEAVSSLDTTAFLAALERIIGRRGIPSDIYSDNGTNFVGAARRLGDWYKWQNMKDTRDAIHQYATAKEVNWHFIPPHAPHFGGLWEAGIKSAKRLLRSVYGDANLTFEEFSTLLVRVESILNSRPLCPLSTDPNDGEYLSPAHFLIGSTMVAPPEPNIRDTKVNYVQRWTLVCRMAQHFWKRWRQEYLNILQIRAKWHRNEENLRVGDLVFLKDNKAPRLQWPRGRILTVHPGDDGIVRVATIKTNNTTYRRSVTDLVPLFPQAST